MQIKYLVVINSSVKDVFLLDDIKDTPLMDFYHKYKLVYLTVESDSGVIYDLDLVKIIYHITSLTPADVDKILPVDAVALIEPNILDMLFVSQLAKNKLRYRSIHELKYGYYPVLDNKPSSITHNVKHPNIRLSPKYNEGAIENICDDTLLSVNGLLHRFHKFNDGVCSAVDANTTINYNKSANLGIVSFKGLGNVSVEPIVDSKLTIASNTPAYELVLINTDTNLTGKLILLSISGILYRVKLGEVEHIDDHIIGVSLINTPYLKMLATTSMYIDFGFTGGSVNEAEITTDEFILNYLSTSTSFIIIIDDPYSDIQSSTTTDDTVSKSHINQLMYYDHLFFGATGLLDTNPLDKISREDKGIKIIDVNGNIIHYNDYVNDPRTTLGLYKADI